MLARSSRLRHPLDVEIETPLLVPSFSSKGFGTSKEGASEVREIFSFATEYLTDIALISAYDIKYGYLEIPDSAITDVIIVDSGGYEISDYQDLSAVYKQSVNSLDWQPDKLISVLDKWPEHIPAIFVSFDRPDIHKSLPEQIDDAKELFSRYRGQMSTLLIKPETKDQSYIQHKNVMAYVDRLGAFDVIGFAEKELGNSVLQRMERISQIRLAMDDAGVSTPIHIYGSLDPLTSVLYFLSGAEIFDGLTWLRYGYTQGLACYQQNYAIKNVAIDRTDDFIRGKSMQDNISYLLDLKHQMLKFLLDGDFSRFSLNGDKLSECYDLLRTKNKRVR